ncbi:IS701 family transposase [Corallococcus exiguus]|uniref:IS701 family transposase n=1 Tax=Corallococcus TaxID=83461 RepID=UPI000EC4A434|nr:MULTISPECIES: IS701 family transposase [Corallococcus]NNC02379.1 IS701 family transposase [Corallococcus exiguus]NPC49235.1 IS701 family transposase [Corallococcus exiguus]RKH82984.1 IS701 family transposase [Corallococcus sp. AB032C]
MQQPSGTEEKAPEVRLVGRLVTELEAVGTWMQPHFRRREAYAAAVEYMKALLGRAQRKNVWGLSEDAGHRAPYAFQHLLLRAKWDADAVRDDVLEYARRALGEGGILAVDETGFLKKGEKSVGVARQCTGTAGKVENAQVGVFLSYVTPLGHALVDRELYLPEPWAEDAARRQAGGIPDEVGFEPKPALAQGMLQRALGAGLKPAWVVGDEVYGRDSTLRRFLEDLHQPYVLAVASNTHVWRGFYQVKPGDMVKEVPPEAWARLSAGAGAKGPRLCDWARMRLNRHLGLSRWLLFRRGLADGKVSFYVAHARRNASLESLVRAAGSRWAVEEDFESAKNEVGLADYEVRTWTAWHRHMTLCLVAHVFLAAARAVANQQLQEGLPPKALGLPRRRNPMRAFLARRGLH